MNLDERLSTALHGVAEQVEPPEVDLDVVRSRARSLRRATALAVAAAVTAVGLAGMSVLAGGRDSTAPQPAASTAAGTLRSLPLADCARGRCLEPGDYGLNLGQSAGGDRLVARLRLAEPGWDSDPIHGVWQSKGNDSVILTVYPPREVASGPPCNRATERIDAGATVDAVARALAEHPQLTVRDGPLAVPAFGHDTRYLQLQGDRVICRDGDGAQYDRTEDPSDIVVAEGDRRGSAADIDFDYPVLIEYWVVDVDGRPMVVEARLEGAPDASMVERLDRVRESLTFIVSR